MPNKNIIISSTPTSREKPAENPLEEMFKKSGAHGDLSGALDWSQGPASASIPSVKASTPAELTPHQKTLKSKQITEGNLHQRCEQLHTLVNSSKQKTTGYKETQKPKMQQSINDLYGRMLSGNVHEGVKTFVKEINGMINEWKRDGKPVSTSDGGKSPVINNYYKDLFTSNPKMHSHIKLLHNLKDAARLMEITFLEMNKKNFEPGVLKTIVENLVSDYLKELKQIVEEDHALSRRKKTPLASLSAIVNRKAEAPIRLSDSDINKRVDEIFKKTVYGKELAEFAEKADVSFESRFDSKHSISQEQQISAPGRKR